MAGIEIKGLEALREKLRALASGKYLDGVLRAAQRRLLNELGQYPPPSAANRPKPAPGRWYERGYGPRWARRGGAGGVPTSEKLGSSWVGRVSGEGLVIANRASYAPIVMGARRQSGLHRRRGWRRVDEIAAAEGGRIEADLVKAVNEVLKCGS